MKGIGRGILENRGGEILEAAARGRAVAEGELPRFPKAPRWDRDPQFDERVSRLKAVRDEHAARLELDQGVLCARDRLEAVARAKPRSVEELATLPELRGWQVEVLGDDFVKALRDIGSSTSDAAPRAAAANAPRASKGGGASGRAVRNDDERSPYRDE